MDWGAGHLTIIVGTGGAGHLPTKIARRAGHLNNFFKCPGVFPGGMLAAGIDSHISYMFFILRDSPFKNNYQTYGKVRAKLGFL